MRLGVYGTLRRGGPANHLLKGAKYLGTDKINGTLYALGDLPCLKLTGAGTGPVIIDIYEVPTDDRKIIESIDRYEGHFPTEPDQSLYVRKVVTTLELLTPVCVYEYKFGISGATKLLDGDWLKW